MAVDLATLNPEALPADVRIQRVVDADTLDTWMTTLAEGYSFPVWLPEPLTRLMAHAGLTDEATISLYLAWLSGQPVATSMVIYAAGAAGIYNVVTLPAARGRGIGRAVTLAPLLEAWERGYRVAVLNATEMGFPVYERLGFARYCDILQYLWPGEPAGGGVSE
jgi:GNAT superfamily N-acetyltransferase